MEPVLKFQAPAPASRSFWLRLQKHFVQKIIKKTFYYCISRLPHKLPLCNRNHNLRLRLHHLKVFGSCSSHPKLLRLHLHSAGAEAGYDLLADCSSVGLYCVTITWQHLQTFTSSYVVGVFPHVTRVPTVGFFSHRSAFFSWPGCLGLILKNHVKSVFF